ncbi:O-antigen polymerase [Emticicia oligotrophica DSM 17448]|uniref:O-antigen polymerase n=1 Tax=Emticicia oligotrophica (strain DSM 17448 / CIP 109782 / MTCC 6937 / GPTSA100-15) TaxID=929562 RepID=A0ABN4AS56_EMTOG|nr:MULTISPECIES: O-antigen ligase family protein [Emticicia]AFK04970.1 O-antigen polymerase [Emticicia oligotrophica DSM 17448]
MKKISSPFQASKGSEQLKKPLNLGLLILFGIFFSLIISKSGFTAGIAFAALPFLFFFLYQLFTYPKLGIYSTIFMGFMVNGIPRYVSDAPVGLAIDGILFLTFIALLVKKQKIDWSEASSGLTIVSIIWMGYNVLEIFNPEARSFEAWFYAMRGVSLYMFLAVPLTFVLLKERKDLDLYLNLWLIISIIGSINGLKQNIIGVDSFEQAWLDAGAAKQHILFGKLRVFSFYSDAGQFGASQAHTLVVATILALQSGLSLKRKIFYFTAAFLSLIGMFISGTRGAMAVPAIGFMTYFFMSKNFRVFGGGVLIGGIVFYILKFTFIGQNVYAINRMRTALDPNDASLLVRLENQKKLANYLASRPFGGGVGSAGSWGLRFSPNSFLAQTPTDSWFVRIWAEEGAVGLTVHLIILFYIAIQGGIILWNLPDKNLRQQFLAIHAGTLGIYVASYGNGILGQMPTGILLYVGWALMFKAKKICGLSYPFSKQAKTIL